MNRRGFLQLSAAGLVASQLAGQSAIAATPGNKLSKPKALKPGDTICLVAPASAIFDPVHIDVARESFQAMGFKVVTGNNILSRHGYLAGTDQQRADDINQAFSDDSIQGIVAIRGGWGCNRLLPLLDYQMVADNPKVLLGYSDITALQNALLHKSKLVSLHGPVGMSYWGEFQASQFQAVAVNGDKTVVTNIAEDDDALAMRKNRARTITSGKASGQLVGGNLTVLSSIVGSPYLPDMSGKILMLEDVGESIYRIDRFLSTLQLSGVLDKLVGVVIGHCSDCDPEKGYGSFTLAEVYQHYLAPLGVPAYFGAQFGHIKDNHIMPVGVNVELDAGQRTVTMLESAVV